MIYLNFSLTIFFPSPSHYLPFPLFPLLDHQRYILGLEHINKSNKSFQNSSGRLTLGHCRCRFSPVANTHAFTALCQRVRTKARIELPSSKRFFFGGFIVYFVWFIVYFVCFIVYFVWFIVCLFILCLVSEVSLFLCSTLVVKSDAGSMVLFDCFRHFFSPVYTFVVQHDRRLLDRVVPCTRIPSLSVLPKNSNDLVPTQFGM